MHYFNPGEGRGLQAERKPPACPTLVDGRTAARTLLAQVHLEFFPRAPQLVIAILAADRAGQVEPEVGGFEEEITEQQTAEMRKRTYAAVRLERTEKRDGADDQHEPLHLHGEDEAKQDGPVREQHSAGHEDAKNGARAANGAHGGIAPGQQVVQHNYADASADSTEKIEL